MRPFALPLELIKALELLSDDERGQAYSAIYAFIYTGAEPGEAISPVARAIYELAKVIIKPKLRRRERYKQQKEKRIETQKAATTQDSSTHTNKKNETRQLKTEPVYLHHGAKNPRDIPFFDFGVQIPEFDVPGKVKLTPINDWSTFLHSMKKVQATV